MNNETEKTYASILPIRNITVTLIFTQPASPQFFHQIALSSLLKHWLPDNKTFEQHFRIDCPETGQSHYASGDYYRFTLYALGDCEHALQTLLDKLQRLPSSAPISDKKAAFRNNIKLASLHDGFNENLISDAHQLSGYNNNSLQQEVALWQNHQKLRLRFISPIRLLKDREKRKNLKGEARFCRDSTDTDINLLLNRLHDRFAEFNRNATTPQNIAREKPPETQTHLCHLFWLDNHYTDKNADKKIIGGMTGLIEFSFNNTQQAAHIWPLLVLGQFTGIGQRTSFGYGRYLLETMDEAVTHRRCLPAQSLLIRAASEENLRQAWRHILKNTTQTKSPPPEPEPDNDFTGEDFTDESFTGESFTGEDFTGESFENNEITDPTLQQLRQTLDKIQQRQYTAPTLKGVLISKNDGGVRALAIPPFNDRVLQRALAQIMNPALEQLFYLRSYGYRPGRSRISAKENIQSAWRNGYTWVYESDIEDFFDSVNLQRLRQRLIALYDNDAAIEGIINWMSASVSFEDELIERKNGLPQGSPLSPLLANLMLDDFDCDMRDAGFLLIRYADDFVVLCKSEQQANRAHLAAQASLSEHGFTLNKDKTQIKSMEQGFKYLGYLFVNDMALDIGGKTPADKKLSTPAQSWLNNISSKTREKIKPQNIPQILRHGGPAKTKTLYCAGERDTQGTLICLTGNNAIISCSASQVHIHKDEKRIYNLPWKSLHAIILFGNHHITTPAMQAALQAAVPIHFSSQSGKYHGTLWNAQPAIYSYRLWQQQTDTFGQADNALYCARQIVLARLIHIKETLRQRKINTHKTCIEKNIRTLHRCQSLASLRGKEGSATKEYFRLLQGIIPAEFNFTGRNRRPPNDPFNALLSLGYTLLYGYTESIVRASGLLPWVGFYHQPRGKHGALASDLMEPFRHLVERTALRLIKQRSLKVDDFSYSPGGACQLSSASRKTYLLALSQTFEVQIKARGQTEPEKIHTHIYQQSLSLIEWITNGEPFQAWRTR